MEPIVTVFKHFIMIKQSYRRVFSALFLLLCMCLSGWAQTAFKDAEGSGISFTVSDLYKLLTQADGHIIGEPENSADLAQGGYSYRNSSNGWTISASDANVQLTSIQFFRHSYFRIHGDGKKRINKIVWESLRGNNGTFVYNNTYNGVIASETSGKSTWTTGSYNTVNDVNVIIMSSNEQNGYVELTGNVKIYYEENNEFRDKQNYTIKITENQISDEFGDVIDDVNDGIVHVIPNDKDVVEPSIVITDDNGNEITNHFQKNYFVRYQPIDDKITTTTDPVTGSVVKRIGGNVVSGLNAGTFDVVVRVFPRSGYEDVYNTTTAIYTVSVDKQTSMKVEIADPFQIYRGVSVPKPTYKIFDRRGNNVSFYYDAVPQVNYDNYSSSDHITGKTVGTENVTWRFKPKFGNSAFETIEKTGVIDVQDPTHLKATVKFYRTINGETKESKSFIMNTGTKTFLNDLSFHVFDEYGNNIDEYYSVLNLQYARCTISSQDIKLRRNGTEYYLWTDNGNARIGTMKVEFTPIGYNSKTDYGIASGEYKIIVGDTLMLIQPKDLTLHVGQKLSTVESSKAFLRSSFLPASIRMDGYSPRITTPGKDYNYDTEYYYTVIVKDSENHTLYDTTDGDDTPLWNVPYLFPQTPGLELDKWTDHGSHFLVTPSVHDEKWDLIAKVAGDYTVTFYINPLNDLFLGIKQNRTSVNSAVLTWNIHVEEKTKPTFVLSENRSVILSSKPYVAPEVQLIDENGEDVTSAYKLEYYSEDFRVNPTEGTIASTSIFADESPKRGVITISATPIDATAYDVPEDASYILTVINEGWTYDLLADRKLPKTPAEGNYNKLVLKVADALKFKDNSYLTSMASGINIRLIPGLSFTAGPIGDGLTFDLFRSGNDIRITGKAVDQFDINGLPTTGLFYKLQPSVNGFATFDGIWNVGHTYVVISQDEEGNCKRYMEFTPTKQGRYEYRFYSPLRAGYTYYLYNEGNGSDAEPLNFYGLEFQPAFVISSNDHEPYQAATAYLNEATNSSGETIYVEHTEGLPKILYKKTANVKLEISDDAYIVDSEGNDIINNYPGYSGKYASISEDGKVTLQHVTTNDISTGNDDLATTPRVKVSLKVSSLEDNYFSSTAQYYMRISGIPTWPVPENYAPNIRGREVIKGFEDAITMTWGGWTGKDAIPYTTPNAWSDSEIDEYQQFNQTVDGFKFQSSMSGNANPLDEKTLVYDPENNPTIANVPCRGDYISFKPNVQGTLYAYVVQQGSVQWNGYDAKNTAQKWKWLPTFIVDETGKGIDGVEYSTAGKVRSSYENPVALENGSAITWDYSAGVDPSMEKNNEAKVAFIKSHWGVEGETEVVSKLDDYYKSIGSNLKNTGGYLIPFKAYVRYSFPVYPGKTYYMFTPGSKLGFAGYAFDIKQMKATDITLDASKEYSTVAEGNTGDHLNVTITGKKMVRNEWNSICLPFSLNDDQVKNIFGEGTEICGLNKITRIPYEEKDGSMGLYDKIGFIEHYYQSINAGYPYMIRPTFENSINSNKTFKQYTYKGVTYDYLDELTYEHVSILPGENQLKEKTVTTEDGSYSLTMKGIYNNNDGNVVIPKGSYYMAWGTLWHSLKGATSVVFNSFIQPSDNSSSGLARMGFTNFYEDVIEDDVPTGIDEVVASKKDDNAHAIIYNIQGQRMGYKVESLPSGVYIINGKKVIVNN